MSLTMMFYHHLQPALNVTYTYAMFDGGPTNHCLWLPTWCPWWQ